MEQQGGRKDYFPIIFTLILVLVVLFIFPIIRLFPNVTLRLPIGLFSFIDIGFIVSLILGIKSKNTGVKVFSIISNAIFAIALLVFICLLLIANGISELNLD